MAIKLGQYRLADKTYSLFGQMLLTAKKYHLALEMYRKLRNCAHTHKDIVSKIYALKQMAFCFEKIEKYESACICLKYLLALAWTCKSLEAEHLAYETLAKMHMYMGNIQKAKFYDARVTYGQYEPEDSQGYRVMVVTTLNGHPWLRESVKGLDGERITGQ